MERRAPARLSLRASRLAGTFDLWPNYKSGCPVLAPLGREWRVAGDPGFIPRIIKLRVPPVPRIWGPGKRNRSGAWPTQAFSLFVLPQTRLPHPSRALCGKSGTPRSHHPPDPAVFADNFPFLAHNHLKAKHAAGAKLYQNRCKMKPVTLYSRLFCAASHSFSLGYVKR